MKWMTLTRGVKIFDFLLVRFLPRFRHEVSDEQIRLQKRVAELESVIREVSCQILHFIYHHLC